MNPPSPTLGEQTSPSSWNKSSHTQPLVPSPLPQPHTPSWLPPTIPRYPGPLGRTVATAAATTERKAKACRQLGQRGSLGSELSGGEREAHDHCTPWFSTAPGSHPSPALSDSQSGWPSAEGAGPEGWPSLWIWACCKVLKLFSNAVGPNTGIILSEQSCTVLSFFTCWERRLGTQKVGMSKVLGLSWANRQQSAPCWSKMPVRQSGPYGNALRWTLGDRVRGHL